MQAIIIQPVIIKSELKNLTMTFSFHSFLEAFKKLDKEGNGFVSKDDLDKTVRQALKSADIEMGEKELAEMWEYIDSISRF